MSRTVRAVTWSGSPSAAESFELRNNFSDGAFFSTAGIRILRGRGFTDDEVAREAPVAVISDTVARTFYSGMDPIGRSLSALPAIRRPQPAATIVGIVADAMLDGPESQIYGGIYRPLSRHPPDRFTDREFAFPPSLIVRSSNPAVTARAVEAAITRVESQVRPVTRLVRESIEQYLGAKRRLAWLLGPMALLSLLLAVVGVYGVTAFVVSQRLAEASVRLALGASPTGVFTMIVKDGLRPVLVGLTMGLGAGLGIGRVIGRELGGISAHDPLAISIAVGALLTCAVVAVVVPARRAATVDPARLLREF
jgi:hypothetical protein